jgi:hypothetical protein
MEVHIDTLYDFLGAFRLYTNEVGRRQGMKMRGEGTKRGEKKRRSEDAGQYSLTV